MATVAQIIITIDDTGAISVAAPYVNKMLCYGMLEVAKDVVKAESEKAERKIQPVSFFDQALVKGSKS